MVMEAIFTILLLANDSFRTCLGHEAVFSVTAGDWVLEKNFNKRSTRDISQDAVSKRLAV
jgi:hypothetical protein